MGRLRTFWVLVLSMVMVGMMSASARAGDEQRITEALSRAIAKSWGTKGWYAVEVSALRILASDDVSKPVDEDMHAVFDVAATSKFVDGEIGYKFQIDCGLAARYIEGGYRVSNCEVVGVNGWRPTLDGKIPGWAEKLLHLAGVETSISLSTIVEKIFGYDPLAGWELEIEA